MEQRRRQNQRTDGATQVEIKLQTKRMAKQVEVGARFRAQVVPKRIWNTVTEQTNISGSSIQIPVQANSK